MKILVTGGGGFIGSCVCSHMIEKGYEVHTIDNLSTGYKENIPQKVKFIQGDCSDAIITKKLDADYQAILHIAGQSSGEISFDSPEIDLKSNTLSTLNLLNFAKQIKCKKFIYASTMSVYGDVEDRKINEEDLTKPLSMYAVGKLASENYLKLFSNLNIEPVSLRLFNVYGPGQNLENLKQGMVSIFLAQAIKNNEIVVKGKPDRFRDLVYIDDVVNVFDYFLHDYQYKKFENFNICSGKKTEVGALLKKIIELLKKEITVKFTKGTPGDQFGIYGDNSKFMSLVKDFRFTDIDEGLKKFIDSVNNEEF